MLIFILDFLQKSQDPQNIEDGALDVADILQILVGTTQIYELYDEKKLDNLFNILFFLYDNELATESEEIILSTIRIASDVFDIVRINDVLF
jgi:hypothetical protein